MTVKTTFKFGAFLMIIFLIVPVIFDCCIPTRRPLPCHNSSSHEDDDFACSTHLQAVTDSKIAFSSDVQVAVLDIDVPVASTGTGHGQLFFTSAPAMPPSPSRLYLRTGALLI